MNRHLVQRAGFALLILTALVVVVPILFVVGVIVAWGGSAISWEFLSAMPSDGMRAGGNRALAASGIGRRAFFETVSLCHRH